MLQFAHDVGAKLNFYRFRLLIPCRYDTLNRDVVCEMCPIGYEVSPLWIDARCNLCFLALGSFVWRVRSGVHSQNDWIRSFNLWTERWAPQIQLTCVGLSITDLLSLFIADKCNEGEFRCGNGTCLDASVRCNGVHDCLPEANDEFGCGMCARRVDKWLVINY